MERTLVLLKPDALQRGLIGKIIERLERKGLKIVGLRMMQLTSETLADHYAHLVERPFYPGIAEFMQRTPVVALCLEGVDAVSVVRTTCGPTNSRDAALGTIRGDFGMSVQANLVHASDSVATANAEIDRFFDEDDLFDYDHWPARYVYSPDEL